MKRIQRGPVRGISLKLQEEERERRLDFVPEHSALEREVIDVDKETDEMLKAMNMKIEGLRVLSNKKVFYRFSLVIFIASAWSQEGSALNGTDVSSSSCFCLFVFEVFERHISCDDYKRILILTEEVVSPILPNGGNKLGLLISKLLSQHIVFTDSF